MAFTKEIVDFSQLDNIEVQKKLEEFHIPLSCNLDKVLVYMYVPKMEGNLHQTYT